MPKKHYYFSKIISIWTWCEELRLCDLETYLWMEDSQVWWSMNSNEGKLESRPTVTRLSLGCLILVRSLIYLFAKGYIKDRTRIKQPKLNLVTVGRDFSFPSIYTIFGIKTLKGTWNKNLEVPVLVVNEKSLSNSFFFLWWRNTRTSFQWKISLSSLGCIEERYETRYKPQEDWFSTDCICYESRSCMVSLGFDHDTSLQ